MWFVRVWTYPERNQSDQTFWPDSEISHMTTTTLRRPKCSIINRFIFIFPCPQHAIAFNESVKSHYDLIYQTVDLTETYMSSSIYCLFRIGLFSFVLLGHLLLALSLLLFITWLFWTSHVAWCRMWYTQDLAEGLSLPSVKLLKNHFGKLCRVLKRYSQWMSSMD